MIISDRIESEVLGLIVNVDIDLENKVDYDLYVTNAATEKYTNSSIKFSANLSKADLLEMEQAIIKLMDIEPILDSLETDAEMEELLFDRYNLKIGYEFSEGGYSYFIRLGYLVQLNLSGSNDKLFYPLLKDIGSIKQKSYKLEEEARRIHKHITQRYM